MGKSIHSSQYAVLLRLLADTRGRAGFTQVELAKRLRTTQSSVSKVERGERRLDIIELYAWCKALKTSFKAFVEELERRLVSET